MSLKQLRANFNYSQEQLAELSNLSLRTIQRIEKDNHGSKQSLTSIANVFNLEYDDFLNKLKSQDIKSTQISERNKTKILRFFTINFILFIINITTNSDYLWFLFPLFGWGIPLFYKIYKDRLR
jgi:transcriptional regulator with XRE-family HTH domain